jgi:hypothetical protein
MAGHGDEAVTVAERWIEVARRADDILLPVPGWPLSWLLLARCQASGRPLRCFARHPRARTISPSAWLG